MANFEDFYYESSTGRQQIHALCCIPEGEIRGVVQIAHGIVEHIDRYREFMAFLAEHGFVAVGNDHLGHGKTISCEEDRGAFCSEDGWNYAVRDIIRLHDLTAQKFPGKKYILFGHSMGSFLVRTCIADYPDSYDLVILSGTGHQARLLVRAGVFLSQRTVRRKGYASDGAKLSALTMGSYLKNIPQAKTPYDWLSRDSAAVDRYIADELCGFEAKAGLYADMLQGIRYVTDMANISKVDPDKPVLFLSGSEDPVGDYGKGVQRAYRCFREAGVRDLSIKLYDGGRHEMLNEVNRDEVYADILGWINARV